MNKKVQVKGYVYSKDNGNEHSHGLYITSWDGRPVSHVHPFSGVTSYDEGHSHQYAGVTGPAIQVPGGRHVHYFEGFTTLNGISPHTHHYRGNTGNEA